MTQAHTPENIPNHPPTFMQGAQALAEILDQLERKVFQGEILAFDRPVLREKHWELYVYVAFEVFAVQEKRRAVRDELYTLEALGLPLHVVLQPRRLNAEG
jgi:hypothetical protein